MAGIRHADVHLLGPAPLHQLDLAKTKAMKPGDKGSLAAGAHHYAVAKGETVVSVSAMGPFAMTYVNPADTPRTGQ